MLEEVQLTPGAQHPPDLTQRPLGVRNTRMNSSAAASYQAEGRRAGLENSRRIEPTTMRCRRGIGTTFLGTRI